MPLRSPSRFVPQNQQRHSIGVFRHTSKKQLFRGTLYGFVFSAGSRVRRAGWGTGSFRRLHVSRLTQRRGGAEKEWIEAGVVTASSATADLRRAAIWLWRCGVGA